VLISVLLPSYNEESNLISILPYINMVMNGYEFEILVVDSMQPIDNTRDICEKNSARYINRRGGDQYGDAVKTGIKEARGDYIVIMDADGSHDAKEILTFYKCITEEDFDLIIGSRYCKGGRTDNPLILIFMSWMLNIVYRFLFSLDIKDISDSFRMYKAEQLRALELEGDNFDIVEEILVKISIMYAPLKVKEVPIMFNKRASGESKRKLVKFILSYFKTINKLLVIKRETKRHTRV